MGLEKRESFVKLWIEELQAHIRPDGLDILKNPIINNICHHHGCLVAMTQNL